MKPEIFLIFIPACGIAFAILSGLMLLRQGARRNPLSLWFVILLFGTSFRGFIELLFSAVSQPLVGYWVSYGIWTALHGAFLSFLVLGAFNPPYYKDVMKQLTTEERLGRIERILSAIAEYGTENLPKEITKDIEDIKLEKSWERYPS